MSSSVGIRALQQNASAVISRVEAGDSVEVTDRGRPVARIVPVAGLSRLAELRQAGQIREATRPITGLRRPKAIGKGRQSLSTALADMRDSER